MKTKLTLSIDPELVAFAHEQARREGTSVSAMMSRHLARKRSQRKVRRPSVDDIVGSLAGYHIDDSTEAIREAYAAKYLR